MHVPEADRNANATKITRIFCQRFEIAFRLLDIAYCQSNSVADSYRVPGADAAVSCLL